MFKKVITTFMACFMLYCFNYHESSQARAFSSDEQMNMAIYDSIIPSIAVINADVDDGVSSGTGFMIDPSGIILTSRHVIEDANKIEVTLPDGKEVKGKLIALVEENTDLALIKVNVNSSFPVLRFADSTKIRVGQKVLAIGNPFGFNGTLTTGIVSRIDNKRNKIQTDAAINPGCSGGPLLNSNGEVIGISQSIYNPDDNKSNIGIGFAVPSNTAKRFIAKIKNDTNSFAMLNK